MKRFVNGQEIDLEPVPDVQVTTLSDRLVVRTPDGANSAVAIKVGDATHISYKGRVYIVEKSGGARRAQAAQSSGEIRAPMPGLIVDVFVEEGAAVSAGDKILVLEAMKTQQAFNAPFSGVLRKLEAAKGQQVSEGQLLALVAIEP